MKKITVAYSPEGEPTLRWAADLARSAHTPLEIFNVFQPSYAEVSTRWFEELLTGRQEELERLADSIVDVDVSVVVREGVEPLYEFARHLHESPGGLGVIGAHGTHRFGGLWFGRPGYSLLHHAVEPIAMIHPHYEPLVGGTIVAAVDGSGHSAAALEWAEQFTRDVGGTLHAVFVHDPAHDPAEGREGWHHQADEVRRIVDKVSTVPVELHMAPGHPSQVLIDHAERVHAAAVVTGTRGEGGFEGLVLGRVPSQLIAHCTTPLIVVPH